jgi:membrane-associated protein
VDPLEVPGCAGIAPYADGVYDALNLLDAKSLINDGGFAVLLAIIFAETGLLIGFFLPGDTLLFLAGAVTVSSPGYSHLNLAEVMIGTAVAAIVGAQVGWLIGKMAGPRIFDRPQSKLFNPHNVERTNRLLNRFHYSFAIIFARFIPVVRTFINPACGVTNVPGRVFFLYNVIGGVIWTQLIVLLGRALGPKVHIDKYVLPIVAAIAVISIAGVFWEARKGAKRNAEAAAGAQTRAESVPDQH